MADTKKMNEREQRYEHERRIAETRRYVAERDGRISRKGWFKDIVDQLGAHQSGRLALA